MWLALMKVTGALMLALLVVYIAPALITPGAAASFIQMWTPVVLLLAGVAGTALAVATAAYRRSGVNRARIEHVESVALKRTSDSASAPRADSPRAGAGSMPISLPSRTREVTYPPWGQLRDVDPTGAVPLAAASDCGWECCAYILRVCRGVEIEADYLRYLQRGVGTAGWSTAAELAACLRHHRFDGAQALAQLAVQATATATTELAAGRPVLALGHFIDAGNLHWVALSAVAPAGVAFMDPWRGARRAMQGSAFWAAYDGALVTAGEAARYPS